MWLVLWDEGAAFVGEEEVIDIFEVVNMRLEAGVEDHVFNYAAGEMVAGGVQKEVGLLAREAQGERELDGGAFGDDVVLVRNDRGVGLAAEVGRLVDGGGVVGIAVAYPDDDARGEREVGGVQVRLARLVLGQVDRRKDGSPAP